jgi:transposase
MTSTTRGPQCTPGGPEVLYLSFELGATEWKLGFAPDVAAKPRIRVMPARDLRRLAHEIAEAKRWFRLPPTTPVRSCYEAGRDGFWLHRHLQATGIDNSIVDSASIDVNRRQRRAKSDRLDVSKLLSMLIRHHAGERRVWSVLRVPTVEAEDRRHLHRELRTLKQEQSRVTSRMKGVLATHGIRLPGRWWHLDLEARLDAVRGWDGAPLPPGVRGRLRRAWAHARFLHEQIVTLERERQQAIAQSDAAAAAQVRQLLSLRAIGPNGAWVFVHELFGWRKFSNRKQVGAAAGLVPTPYQSGDTQREQGISKAGNHHLRAVTIEAAWCWVRYQPDSGLSRWYHTRFARAGARARKVGIVALARKLLIALWRFLAHGVVPDGARLKPVTT